MGKAPLEWETDSIPLLRSVPTNLTKEERERIISGEYIKKDVKIKP